MRNDIRTGVLAIIVFTVLLGLAYPLAMTGAGQAVATNPPPTTMSNGNRLVHFGKIADISGIY